MRGLDLRLGDGLAGLDELESASVQLVFSDIPAGITRADFDKLPDLHAMMTSMWRVLPEDGVIALMVAELRVAARLSCLRHYRYDMVWPKSRGTGFLNARKRPIKAHEHLLIFYRRQPSYKPQMTEGHKPIHGNAGRASTGANYGKASGGQSRKGATTRFPTTILRAPIVGTTAPERVHPQQKDPTLASWFILSYTQPGDLVADPYAGSGSTGRAALRLGRRFVGWELNEANWSKAMPTQG